MEAARAGAAIVHIHVREPETGAFSMETRHYREVVKRIRESKVDVIVNLTCGMGGYIWSATRGCRHSGRRQRLRQPGRAHAACHRSVQRGPVPAGYRDARLRQPQFRRRQPRLCLNPEYCREGAAILRDLGVKPELEVFDTGNLWFVKQMIKEGLIPAPALIQLCMGIPYGVPADTGHLLAMVNSLPRDACGVHSPSAACRCPGWRSRCCSAATCASGWRTTCT